MSFFRTLLFPPVPPAFPSSCRKGMEGKLAGRLVISGVAPLSCV
ncbi:Protein of unknown function [Pyronema omphalodes CBS 100304]|uniref:Uncharacterized protein n=1 Tax=Pyronema omphalodes (strain CBS 100304) TaxID=1076935 RepID=U4L0Q5_PYROM|nr:Protein of unknown function [Pyronema omphalodes CBS 100304]